jgi:hypothetical protein
MKHLFFCLLLTATLTFTVCAQNGNTNNNPPEGNVKIKITIGTKEFTAVLYDNTAVRNFAALLPLTLDMSELNGNEKYNYLPDNLPASAERVGSIKTGDLMLYGSNCLVLFYKNFSTSYTYTKLGVIEDISGLTDALGGGSVQVTFSPIN